MTVQQINQKLEKLREEYKQSPQRRTIIQLQARALKRALEEKENNSPPQKMLA